MSLPDAQGCKANAISALARVAELDPEITGEERDVVMTAMLVGIAQVWATLATVPDEESKWVPGLHPNAPSRGGAAQWREG